MARKKALLKPVAFLSGLLFAVLTSCSVDNPGAPQGGTTNRLVAPLENAVVDVPLTANQPTTTDSSLPLRFDHFLKGRIITQRLQVHITPFDVGVDKSLLPGLLQQGYRLLLLSHQSRDTRAPVCVLTI